MQPWTQLLACSHRLAERSVGRETGPGAGSAGDQEHCAVPCQLLAPTHKRRRCTCRVGDWACLGSRDRQVGAQVHSQPLEGTWCLAFPRLAARHLQSWTPALGAILGSRSLRQPLGPRLSCRQGIGILCSRCQDGCWGRWQAGLSLRRGSYRDLPEAVCTWPGLPVGAVLHPVSASGGCGGRAHGFREQT